MILQSKKFNAVALVALILIALALSVATLVKHVAQLRLDAEHTFRSRSELLTKFVATHRDQVSVMRNLLVERYSTTAATPVAPFPSRNLHEGNRWELFPQPAGAQGAVSGSMLFPRTPELDREIDAALAMDAQIRAALEFDREAVWLYYISTRGFMYIAPRSRAEHAFFTPELFERRYWLEARPEGNPTRRMIISGPYRDLGGMGNILTFAEPVYVGDEFLGLVALDVRLDTLQMLTNVGDAIGESMIISENDRLIARQTGSTHGTRVHPPLSHTLVDWREDPSGDLWLSSPVVRDELWLVHRVKWADLFGAAAQKSVTAWLAIALMGFLGHLALRLREALVEVVRLTQVDPLTQTLNRRGFYDKAAVSLAVAKRKHLAIAVLIMDIDFFKKVNDGYGHAVGDEVLKQLGWYLLQACRPYDLLCRWGGEEFVAVLLLERPEDALAVAERLRQEGQRTRVQPDDKGVTLSGGLVLLKTGEMLDHAIERADELLYQAKKGGRDRIVASL